MLSEYNVELVQQRVSYHSARWLPNKSEEIIRKLESAYSTYITKDLEGNPIVLFDSGYALSQAEEKVGAENLFKYKREIGRASGRENGLTRFLTTATA